MFIKEMLRMMIPDKIYLRMLYRKYFKKKINLEKPITFNEKLQWLKLYSRKPEYTMMVDKYAVKQYVEDKIGDQYIIPTLGVWSNFDEIDFDKLPDQFVLKCTHDSGGVFICKNKNIFDKQLAKNKINKSLKIKYFYKSREWPYKNVPRKIIAEKYMVDNSVKDSLGCASKELTDYKFMCFNGKVKLVFTCTDRFSKEGLKVTFYDEKWNIMPFTRHYPAREIAEKKPKSFEKMISLAEKLAEGIPFVRIDFYEVGGNIYFGEITFFPGGGLEEFSPESWDSILGSWITLPDKSK